METMEKIEKLEALARLMRYYILTATTHAGSGHPTSSLSATELMGALLFGGPFPGGKSSKAEGLNRSANWPLIWRLTAPM